MQSGIDEAEARGLLQILRKHMGGRQRGDAIVRVDCTSLIDIWEGLDDMTEKKWVKLPNMAIWREIDALRRQEGGEICIRHNKSHRGSRDEGLVDGHAKVVAGRSEMPRTVEDYYTVDLEYNLVDRVGGPIQMGAKKAVKRVVAVGYRKELAGQAGQGHRTTYMRQEGVGEAEIRGGRFWGCLMTSTLLTGRQNAWRYSNLYG
jgi:hypothetical protein